MPTPILHIGYHKTASTWFQKNLYPQANNYRYIDRITARNAFLFDHAFSFDASEALVKLKCSPRDAVILCDEDLSGNFHSAGLFGGWTHEIARRLAATFPEARVVIFIREQKALLSSIYQQYIREGGTHKPSRYFHPYTHLPRRGFQPAKVPLFSFSHFHYPCLIMLYQKLFGPENVHVFMYEAFRQNHREFMKQYCRRLDLEINAAETSSERLNVSYQRYALAVARAVNHFTWRDVVDKRCWIPLPGVFKFSRKWIRSLNKRLFLGGPTSPESLLGLQLMSKIDQLYCADNRWLMHHLHLPLQDHGYAL